MRPESRPRWEWHLGRVWGQASSKETGFAYKWIRSKLRSCYSIPILASLIVFYLMILYYLLYLLATLLRTFLLAALKPNHSCPYIFRNSIAPYLFTNLIYTVCSRIFAVIGTKQWLLVDDREWRMIERGGESKAIELRKSVPIVLKVFKSLLAVVRHGDSTFSHRKKTMIQSFFLYQQFWWRSA